MARHYMDIDLRYYFDQIIDNFGNQVLLQRNNQNMHCSCWNQIEKDSTDYINNDSVCPICLGEGKVNVIEKVWCRRMAANFGDDRAVLRTDLGNWQTNVYKFFFYYDTNPNVHDVIYECTFRKNGEPQYLLGKYRITNTEQMRADDGRIEYWRVIAEYTPINKEIINVQIKRIRNKIVYIFNPRPLADPFRGTSS
jgi:hypothetical protein